MTSLLVVAKRYVFFALIWVVLAGTGATGLVVGALVAASATWLSLKLLPPHPDGPSVVKLATMVPGFLWRSLLGGIDVARRAFDPRLPLSPNWIAYETGLPEGGARAALGGEFSLMPGTLVAGSRGNVLLVHCLDASGHARDHIHAEEARLRRALGLKEGDRSQ